MCQSKRSKIFTYFVIALQNQNDDSKIIQSETKVNDVLCTQDTPHNDIQHTANSERTNNTQNVRKQGQDTAKHRDS
jgi:hypothetical protein